MSYRHTYLALTLVAGLSLGSATWVRAQDISQIGKSDPLVITGAVGTQNTYRYTSGGRASGSPLSNMIYANLNVSVYGISMPFSLYYSNDNLAFNYPQLSLNFNPTYKNWSGHLGQSSMDFSPYVMNMSFNGVGLEYHSERFRTGAFYGVLRKAVNDDPSNPLARTPQYKRVGWGFKVGYGTTRNYIDLYFLRAYDRPNSLDEQWRNYIRPQENLVVGLRGCLSLQNWLSLTTNVATSAFTGDVTAEKIDVPEAQRFDKVFSTRYSSTVRFAGDANINVMARGFNASLSYRILQPDYTSLGTYYMSNNYQSFGINMSTILFRRLSLSGSFSAQEDNLTKQQMFTTRGLIYNAMLNTRIGKNLNVSMGYNGYLQTQTDGTMAVVDSTRVHRRMSSYSITPSYAVESEVLAHNISLSANYTQNLDLNRFSEKKNDINTLALGLNYSMMIKPWEVDVTASWSHQMSEGYRSRYTSDIGSIDIGRSFLSDKTLHVSAGVNLCYNHILRQSKSLSLGGQINAGYTLKKAHTFSASASLYKYGDVNMSQTTSHLDDTDLTVSLNYAYTFDLLHIKRKAKRTEGKK